MLKNRIMFLALCLLVVIIYSKTIFASGIVTFQIEVVPGFTITSPETLVFQPVAPGQVDQQNLSIVVWSNVRWGLSVNLVSDDTEGLRSYLEFRNEQGKWSILETYSQSVNEDQPITGPNGQEVNIPVRFRGNYDDLPGVYSFGVQFTVVPEL